jgi:hypothetical protein
MISRRQLCLQAGAATVLSAAALKSLAFVDPPTFKADAYGVALRYQKGVWDLKADHLSIGGIPVPTTSWGWIGLTVAQRVLSAVGGLIVNLVVGLLTKSNEPSMAELMRKQLEAFAQIVVEAARQSLVTQAKGQLASEIQLLQEYVTNPKGAGKRLDYLLNFTNRLMRTSTSKPNLQHISRQLAPI